MAVILSDGVDDTVVNPAVCDLFAPYDLTVLGIGDFEDGGPSTKVLAGAGNRAFLFGYDITKADWRSTESNMEVLLHEVAHGIEYPLDRFGLSNWGMHFKKNFSGEYLWQFERELLVHTIQKRLHKHFVEPYSYVAMYKSVGINSESWINVQGKFFDSCSVDYRRKLMRRAIDVFDALLPPAETLIGKWHEKCRALDANPSFLRVDPLPGEIVNIDPVDPLNLEYREALRSVGLVA